MARTISRPHSNRGRRAWSTALAGAALAVALPTGTATAQGAVADVFLAYPAQVAGPFATTAPLYFEVGNAGPSSAGAVVLTFLVPDGVSVVAAETHAPWSATQPVPTARPCAQPDASTLVCAFDGTFDADVRTGATITVANTGLAAGSAVTLAGHLASDTVDPQPGNNDVVATITFEGAAVGLDTADLAVHNDAVMDEGNPSIRSLLFSVRNAGPAAATGVTVTITVPEGVALITVDPPASPPWSGQEPTVCTVADDGRQAVCNVGRPLRLGDGEYVRAVVVNAALPAGSSADVTATARASTDDGYGSNDALTVPVTFVGGPVALDAADVALVPLSGPGVVTDPSVIRTDLGVRNNGPARATAITVTIDVPDGVVVGSAQTAPAEVPIFTSCPMAPASARLVCTSADLSFGGFRQLPIVVINVGLPAGSTVEVRARVTHAEADPTAADDSLVVPITFTGPPVPTRPGETTTELAVAANEPTRQTPDELTFVWNIAVRGPAPAQGLTAVVQLGPGLRATWAGLVPSGGACPVDPASSTITCVLTRPWPAGEPLGLIVAAAADPSATGGRFEAEAFVASDLPDPFPANNRSAAAFAVSGGAPPTSAPVQVATSTLPATGRDTGNRWVLGAALLMAGLHVVLFSRSFVPERSGGVRRRRSRP